MPTTVRHPRVFSSPRPAHADPLPALPQNAMVPELAKAKKALVDKLKTTPMLPTEVDFIYKTLRQIEKLLAINNLSPQEARVLRQNLSSSTEPVNPAASQELRKLLKRHSLGPAPRRRSSKGVGPRMGPGRRAAAEARARGDAARARGGGGGGGGVAQASSGSLPPIDTKDGSQSGGEIVNEWSAITLFQDRKHQEQGRRSHPCGCGWRSCGQCLLTCVCPPPLCACAHVRREQEAGGDAAAQAAAPGPARHPHDAAGEGVPAPEGPGGEVRGRAAPAASELAGPGAGEVQHQEAEGGGGARDAGQGAGAVLDVDGWEDGRMGGWEDGRMGGWQDGQTTMLGLP
jgi:hypothetical protein